MVSKFSLKHNGRRLLMITYEVEIIFLFPEMSSAQLFVRNGDDQLINLIAQATNSKVKIIKEFEIIDDAIPVRVLSHETNLAMYVIMVFVSLVVVAFSAHIYCMVRRRYKYGDMHDDNDDMNQHVLKFQQMHDDNIDEPSVGGITKNIFSEGMYTNNDNICQQDSNFQSLHDVDDGIPKDIFELNQRYKFKKFHDKNDNNIVQQPNPKGANNGEGEPSIVNVIENNSKGDTITANDATVDFKRSSVHIHQ